VKWRVTVNLLRDGYYALKRDAAPRVDGMTWKEYERRAWMRSWQTCMAEFIGDRIEHSLPREPAFRKPMDANVR
jgi:hypothetical protein